MGLFHIYLVSLRCVLLIVLAVAPFLMVGTATDGRANLAGVPSWDIKSTRDAHVPVIVVLVERLVVPARCLPTLMIGVALLRWRLPSKCGSPLVVSSPPSSLASLASSPSSLKSWRWSCGRERWSYGYGCVCCHCWRGVVAGSRCWWRRKSRKR